MKGGDPSVWLSSQHRLNIVGLARIDVTAQTPPWGWREDHAMLQYRLANISRKISYTRNFAALQNECDEAHRTWRVMAAAAAMIWLGLAKGAGNGRSKIAHSQFIVLQESHGDTCLAQFIERDKLAGIG